VNTVPPIRREILVEADPAVAFEVFTSGLGRWWPVAELSVHGEGGSVSFHGAFAGGQIVERSAAGETAVWGTVTRWEPPDAVAFTWHPGQPAERASQVEITFAVAEPAEYDHGWPLVLDRYAGHIAGRGADVGSDGGEETWVALLHRPGPEAPRDGSVFTDPRFGEHVAFLARMHAAGYLVAAGPLADAEGEGMTILRLPGPGQLGTATRLATEDDISVASGFFSVTVRPWQVVMSGA
jgi:uncharacterized protein YciI